MEACLLDWSDYPLSGITYSPAASHYYCPVMCCHHDINNESQASPVSAPTARTSPKRATRRSNGPNVGNGHLDGWRMGDGRESPSGRPMAGSSQRSSSVSSEGFCDNDMGRESDSPRDRRSPEQQDSGQVSRQNSREEQRIPMPHDPLILPDILPEHNLVNANIPQDMQFHGVKVEDARWPGRVVRENNASRRLVTRGDMRRNDEYRLYSYDIIASNEQPSTSASSQDKTNPPDVFANIKKLEDPNEILFARAEGLHAHGHISDASRLAVQLAQELLAHPPNLMIDLPVPARGKRKKVNFKSNCYILWIINNITLQYIMHKILVLLN